MSEEELKQHLLEIKGSLAMLSEQTEETKSILNSANEKLDALAEFKVNSMEQAWLNEFRGIYRRLEELEDGKTNSL